MRMIRLSDLVEMPWKNGAGVTRDIAQKRAGADLLWRLSMADVASDGPFSDFTGLMRVLTVIEGGGMELKTPHGVLQADPGVPVMFDGGMPVVAKLKSGPLRDLNLMFNPLRITGSVTAINGPATRILRADAAHIHAVYCLSGSANLTNASALRRGDTALFEAGGTRLTLPTGASALLIALTSHP